MSIKIKFTGIRYEIYYRVPGCHTTQYESFKTEAEANLRVAEIEVAKQQGTLRPKDKRKSAPKYETVSELLDWYVQHNKAWSPNYARDTIHRIDDYIKPFIGNKRLKELTPADIEDFYELLASTPAVAMKGHKDKTKTVGASVIQKVHMTLSGAFSSAKDIKDNPMEKVTPPSYTQKPRRVWSKAELQNALALCDDTLLCVALYLGVGCTLRIGEILGLQWDCVHIEPELVAAGKAYLEVNKQLQRCDKGRLQAAQDDGKIFYVFPDVLANSKNCLVLKSVKTDSSKRTVFIPKTVAEQLTSLREQQNAIKAAAGDQFTDYGLVFTLNNGRPVETRNMEKRLNKFIAEHDLPKVVFHSTRHNSTSIKLQLSHGDIKAVQGDTGHSVAKMVSDTYAEIDDEDRRLLAAKMENDFFSASASGGEVGDLARVIELLQSRPELITAMSAFAKAMSA